MGCRLFVRNGRHWGVDRDCYENNSELERFFSFNTVGIRTALQSVEWSINREDDNREIQSIDGLENEYGISTLTER